MPRNRLLQAPWIAAALAATAAVALAAVLFGGWPSPAEAAMLGVALASMALVVVVVLVQGRARGAVHQAIDRQQQQLQHSEALTRQLRSELAAHADSEARLKQLNDQLAETERFMRLVTDNIPARLAYWDSERRCLFINRAGYAKWGKRREDFIGHTSKEIFGPDFTSANEPYSAAALRGEAQIFEREGSCRVARQPSR